MDTGSYKNPLRSLAVRSSGGLGPMMDTGLVGNRMDTGRMDTGGWLFAVGAQEVRPYMDGPLPGWDDIFPPDEDTASNTYKMLPVAELAFPDRAWDPFLLAGAIAGSFAATANWTAFAPQPPPDAKNPAALAADLTALMAHRRALENGSEAEQAQRAALLTEELEAQRFGTERYFSKLLACSPEFRPATHLAVMTCIQVGGLVASRFKLKYKRARPAQTWPVIRPLLPTPRHPSYPSGHALQCFLIAKVLGTTVPAIAPVLERLAMRIAVNRERAGVHYPSDTAASHGMVPGILTELAKTVMEHGDATKTFGDLMTEVAGEWSGATPGTAVPIAPKPAA